MCAQCHDHPTVHQSADGRCRDTGQHAAADADPGGCFRLAPVRTENVEHQCADHRSQGIDGTDTQIDLTGHNDEGCSDSHDGDETGVLGEIGEVFRAKEFVLRFQHELSVAIRVFSEHAFQFAKLIGLHLWNLDRATEDGEQRAQPENHQHQTQFLETERA